MGYYKENELEALEGNMKIIPFVRSAYYHVLILIFPLL